ncbi:gfo/Idh/MocA family oxidoreductase [Candidatus Parcubacteria bacterium]|nr:MAG: gfo/Idh/MocA family oxidoreductase [Candidatus Parcubacteria bacterium]
MKFLICGLGSIGKRHLENLEKLGVKCEDILIYRTGKGTKNFGDKVLSEHGGKHPVFYSIDDALKEKPTAAIITNPTSLHIPMAITAAQAGCHIFLEKPISHSLEKVDDLKKITERKRLKVFVAYQLRFHPLFKQIQKWLNEERIGKVLCVHMEMAERLTDWHPWEDYRASYASREDLGGGVVLTQSHELDMLYSLFGKSEWIFATGGKLSNLDIEVEDMAKSIMQFPNGVIASLHVDYFKKPPSRFIEITGAKGRIRWDYFKKEAKIIPMEGNEEIINEPAGYERNMMYIEIMSHFLKALSGKAEELVDLEQGKTVLEMALRTKQSILSRKII